ncbi:MAG: filamentous hemagglutinin N-terminal domain-containing protein, partial [Mycobacterium sp.]
MRRRRGHLSRAFLLTAAFLLPAGLRAEPAAQALPSAPAVTAGAAEVGVTGAAMVVEQSSDRAVINWRSFSVGRDASVEFRVPSASSATLNRVLGSDPSAVFGSLRSNGTVILVNPNGVLFGASSRVDVGSLVATAHAITDADFMAGRLEFSRSGSGSVVNEGEIRARLGGYVALLAPEVRNAGLIMAQAGTVALAAGERITLNFDPAGSLTGLLVTPSQVAALVENRHAVLASGGRILMSAQGFNALAAGAIRSSGSLDVGAITERGGRVLIEASHEAEVGGSVIASSAVEEGGAVTLAARDVRVSADASIDASGGKAGGQVLLGGGWQGGGWTLQARRSEVGLGAVIDVSARGLGDGGTAVVWSDITDPLSLTTVAGRILARGGELGGDGGRVETSGHTLDSTGAVVLAGAPAGRGGLWLIDPADSTINATVVSGYQTTLNSGTSILNDVVGDINWQAGADLTKSAGGDATLTLRTTARLNVLSNITSTSGKLNLILWSDSDNTLDSGVSIGQPVTFSTNGGHLWIGGGAAGATWNGLAVGSGASRGSTAGNYNGTDLRGAFNTAGGNIRIAAATTIDLVANPSFADVYLGWLSALTINAGSGNIEIVGDKITYDNGSSVTTTGSLTITPWNTAFTSAYAWGATLTNGGASALTINSPSAMAGFTLGKASNTANITVNSALTIGGPVRLFGGSIAVNAAVSATGDLLLDADTGVQLAGNFTGLAIGANLSTTAASNGSITLRGRGGNNAAGGQIGVNVASGVSVAPGGSGFLDVEGTGGNSVGATNLGVRVYGTLTSGSGNLTVTGLAGGAGASTNNDGIAFHGGAV